MITKEFKTYEEMVDLLNSRGMHIHNSQQRRDAKHILKWEGYYNVINGYKRLFLISSNPEQYISSCTIDQVFALYNFDRIIREIFLRSILRVETNIKALLSYTISAKYGPDNYLIYKNFDTNTRDAEKKISKLISSVQGQISAHSLDPNISHYLKTYGYIPMWVLTSILTFGNTSKFYSLMKQQDRQQISRTLQLQDNGLANFLNYLSVIRNFCAHGNRLYCFKTKSTLANTSVHKSLDIPKKDGHFTCGRNDLFAAVIALKYLLPPHEFENFFKELSEAVDQLSEGLQIIPIATVLNAMGFPENWKAITSVTMHILAI